MYPSTNLKALLLALSRYKSGADDNWESESQSSRDYWADVGIAVSQIRRKRDTNDEIDDR